MSWRERSFDVLPALSVRGKQLRNMMRLVTVAWAWGVVWSAATNGDQWRAFMTMVGFNDFAFGMLTAIPFVATFVQVYAAILIERTGLRKYQFLDCFYIHRSLYLVLAIIPFLVPIPTTASVITMLAVLGVSQFVANLGQPGWMTWMGDLIPRRIRGRYFARRSQITQAVNIVSVMVIGLIMDYVALPGTKGHESAAGQPALLKTLSAIVAIGAIFGMIDIWLFSHVREVLPPKRDPNRKPVFHFSFHRPRNPGPLETMGYYGRCMWEVLYKTLLEPMKDRIFRHYVMFGATITFSNAIAGWFYIMFAKKLGFSSLGVNAMFMVVGIMSGMLSAGWSGKLIDRWGRRPVLLVMTIGTMLSAVPWFFALPALGGGHGPAFLANGLNAASGWVSGLVGSGNWQLVGPETPLQAYILGFVACAIGGTCWGGVGLAQTAVILGFSDGQGRDKHVAAAAVLMSIGGAVGGASGGAISQSLSFLQEHPIGPFLWNNWHVVFLISLLIRIVSIMWLVNMPDPGARPVRAMLKDMTSGLSSAVIGTLFFPLRIFGWAAKPRVRRGDE